MPPNTEIKTSFLKTSKLLLFVLCLIIFILVSLLSTLFVINKYRTGFSIIIISVGVILFFILPILFFNKRISLFANKAILILSSDFLKIYTLNKKTLNIKERHEYLYNDIKAFQIAESKANTSSYLKLVLKNGKKIKYSFFEQTDNKQNVLKNVQVFFTSYNEGKSLNEKISLLPTFYNTKAGKYIIIGLAVLIVIVVLLQAIYKPQTIPFSLLIGIMLYFRIKSQQKSDIELYEKFK